MEEFSELTGLCEFLVIERPGCPMKIPPPSVKKDLLPLLRYTPFQGPTIHISSSEIRRSIREGKKTDAVLSPAVREYINTHQLYTS